MNIHGTIGPVFGSVLLQKCENQKLYVESENGMCVLSKWSTRQALR